MGQWRDADVKSGMEEDLIGTEGVCQVAHGRAKWHLKKKRKSAARLLILFQLAAVPKTIIVIMTH